MDGDRQEEMTIQVVWRDVTIKGHTLKFGSEFPVVWSLQKEGPEETFEGDGIFVLAWPWRGLMGVCI